MLVLTQRPGQDVIITTETGVEITVSILGVNGNQVRMGYVAPRTINIDRATIHERKKRSVAGEASGNV